MSLFPARRKTVGLAMAAGLASSLLALGGVTAPSSATDTVPTTAALRIGSYNIRAGEPLSDFKAGVKFIMSRAEVVGLQEAAGNARHNWLGGAHPWRAYFPPDDKQEPIVWNPRAFEVLSADEFKLADGALVEDVKNNDKLVWKDASFGAVAKMRQISTGYVFAFINVHLVHGAIQGGKPVKGRPRLWDLYKQQVASLQAEMASEQSRGLPVYATGDFNIGYAQDKSADLRPNPYRQLTGIDSVATWKNKTLRPKGTFMDPVCRKGVRYCGSYMDQTWGPTQSAAAKVYTKVVHSDHYPIRSTYWIPVPAGYVPPTGTVGFATTSLTAPEWDKPWQSRQNPMVFPLTGDRSHGFATVEVTGGTAVEGRDFTLDDSSLYDADPTNDRVVVTTIPNTTHNSDRTFTLSLVNPFDATILDGEGTATGVIQDDD